MILSTRYPITSPYRLAVCGWGESQTFFFEKSELEWNQASGKQLALSHAVRNGRQSLSGSCSR
jgi:hypothetical protein